MDYETKTEVQMTTTIDERLAEAGRRIDDLEAAMRLRGSDERRYVRRHVEALRQEQANAEAAARRTPDPVGERLSRLRSRLDVAERSLQTDRARGRSDFTAAVEAELHAWDAFAERLQTTAAARTGSARDRAESGIKELRRRRLAVTERLDDLRNAPQEACREHQERVTAARDELERMADDLSASLF
jgi:hypothetical protein